jgi:hypothetical protein
MNKDFINAYFRYINLEGVDVCTILYGIARLDLYVGYKTSRYLRERIKDHYKYIHDIFNKYPSFDMDLFTHSFSYSLYLQSVNFRTGEVNYNDEINLNVISYNIIKYLKKSLEITEHDLHRLYVPYIIFNKRKNNLTRNFIYNYYKEEFNDARDNEECTLQDYYDSAILDRLQYYNKLVDRDSECVIYNYDYI